MCLRRGNVAIKVIHQHHLCNWLWGNEVCGTLCIWHMWVYPWEHMAVLTCKQAQMFHTNIKRLLRAYSFYLQSLRGLEQEAWHNIIQLNHLNTHYKWLEIDEDMESTCKKNNPIGLWQIQRENLIKIKSHMCVCVSTFKETTCALPKAFLCWRHFEAVSGSSIAS